MRAVVAGVLIAAVATAASLAESVSARSPDVVPAGMTLVASGRWHSTPWRFAANDAHRELVLWVEVGDRGGAWFTRRLTPFRHGPGVFALIADESCAAQTDYVAGSVTGRSHTVVIGLSSGKSISTIAIPPRRGLVANIAFFIVRKPPRTEAVSVVARDRSAQVVASWRWIHTRARPRVVC